MWAGFAASSSHVRDAFVDEAAIDRQWRDLNYYGRPDLPRASTSMTASSS
jgi:hypothetical protein